MINLQVNRDKQKEVEAPNGIHGIKEPSGKLGAAETKQSKSQTDYILQEGKSSPTHGCRWQIGAGNQGQVNKQIAKREKKIYSK